MGKGMADGPTGGAGVGGTALGVAGGAVGDGRYSWGGVYRWDGEGAYG